MALSEVPRVVQSISEPPQWFVNGINSVKDEIKSVKDELKEDNRILRMI